MRIEITVTDDDGEVELTGDWGNKVDAARALLESWGLVPIVIGHFGQPIEQYNIPVAYKPSARCPKVIPIKERA